jgi:hypothetical protein
MIAQPTRIETADNPLKQFISLHTYDVYRPIRKKEGIMVRRVFGVLTCFVILAMTCVVMAGGVVAPMQCAPPQCAPAPCAPAPCGPAMGNPCAFWGDAPFPGLCGGVVALPFLVVGSLLGGSPMGPPPAQMAPAPYGPRPYMAPRGPVAPCAPPAPCGPAGYGPAAYGSTSLLGGGLPCLELCSSILGSFSGVAGLGLY